MRLRFAAELSGQSGRIELSGPALPLWIAALATIGTLVVAFTLRARPERRAAQPNPVTPVESQGSTQDLPGPEGGVLADLTWLVGTWRTVEFGRDVHEMHWSPSYSHSMAGSLRSIRLGHEPAYVFLVLEEDEAGVRLHYRELGSGNAAAATKLATLVLAEHGKGWISFSRGGRESPLSVEFRVKDGNLCLTLGDYCEEGGLYRERCYEPTER